MQHENERENQMLSEDDWLEEQRVAIERDRNRIRESLTLFQRAMKAVPKLDARLHEYEEGARKIQLRLEAESARLLTSLGAAGAEQGRILTEKCHSLADEARQSMAETRLRLEESFHSLSQRLDATKTALGQDRMVINQLNRKLIEQSERIDKLTQRLEELEKEQRDGLAAIRGTTSQLQGRISRLGEFRAWFVVVGWWRRLFEKPSDP